MDRMLGATTAREYDDAAEPCWHRVRRYTLVRRHFDGTLAANRLIPKLTVGMAYDIHARIPARVRIGDPTFRNWGHHGA